MSAESDRALLAEQVTALVRVVLPGATFLDIDSPLGTEAVSFAAYDETDPRPAAELAAALDAALRAGGWHTSESSDGATQGLNVAKEGLGGGVFGVQTSVISFMGLARPGGPRPAGEPGASTGASTGPSARLLADLSAEIRAAIQAATPRPVYPRDDFEDAGALRIAGWDPDERQSNEALLDKAVGYLAARGWSVGAEPTDSEDRSARVAKAGFAAGRLYAANQSLTFTGCLTP